jgi:hypothetical protein
MIENDIAPVYIALGSGSAMRHRHLPSFPPGMRSGMFVDERSIISGDSVTFSEM